MMYAVSRSDGGVTILHTVQQPDGRWPTPQECIAKWTPAAQAAVVTIREITMADIPTNRTSRNAWMLNGNGKVRVRT